MRLKFLLTALTITSLNTSISFNPSAFAFVSPLSMQQDNQSKFQLSLLGNLQQMLGRRLPRPRISRGFICPLSPGIIGSSRIWNDRPLFLWGGDATHITLTALDNPELKLIDHALETTDTYFQYEGSALQPGQFYQWTLSISSQSSVSSVSFTFQAMDSPERDTLGEELQKIEKQVNEPEAIAISQVQYFAGQDFWSDAIQRLYQIESPSIEVKQSQTEISAHFCPIQSTASTAKNNQY
jgi:hypothetical protein